MWCGVVRGTSLADAHFELGLIKCDMMAAHDKTQSDVEGPVNLSQASDDRLHFLGVEAPHDVSHSDEPSEDNLGQASRDLFMFQVSPGILASRNQKPHIRRTSTREQRNVSETENQSFFGDEERCSVERLSQMVHDRAIDCSRSQVRACAHSRSA